MESTCRNCGQPLIGKYCHACGQRHYGQDDKSLKAIGEETLHFLTHFDGSVPLTLRTILLRPGRLTSDYCAGIRKKYYKPVSFFLLLIVIYLLFPMYEGLNMRADFYRSLPVSGPLLNWQLDHLMALRGWDAAQLGKHFHHVSEKVSKIMLLLLIPLAAVALRIVGFKKRKPAFDLLIAATEINIVMLLLLFLISTVVLYLISFFFNISSLAEEAVLSCISAAMIVYVWLAIYRFYGGPWWKNTLRTAIFLVLYTLCVQVVYKFFLFETVYIFL